MNDKIRQLFESRPAKSRTCCICRGSGKIDQSYCLEPEEYAVSSKAIPSKYYRPTNLGTDAIIARIRIGSSILEATKEASDLAKQAQFPIAFLFNEIAVIVKPGDDPDVVAEEWWIRAYGETPEQTFQNR